MFARDPERKIRITLYVFWFVSKIGAYRYLSLVLGVLFVCLFVFFLALGKVECDIRI